MTKYHEIIRLAGLNLSQTNIALSCNVFFASTFWTKLQNIFGHGCMSKLDKIAMPRLATNIPATSHCIYQISVPVTITKKLNKYYKSVNGYRVVGKGVCFTINYSQNFFMCNEFVTGISEIPGA